VSLGLLLLAVAVLVWPGRRRLDRARLEATDDVGGPLGRVATAFRRLPVPSVAGCAAAATASLVSTGLVAGVAGLCGALAARAWIAGRRAAREQADLASLAEALGALGAELRSGRSLEAAAPAAAAAGGNERCGRALVLAVRAPGVAVPTTPGPLGQALARISSAVLLSGRTGCSLASIVGAVEDDLRARLRHARELRAATAGPRSSAFLLAGLPLLGLLMGSGVGADPWHVLTATGPGNALLVAGVGLEIAGVAWSGQLVERALR
jgi:tight adherence protein B